MYIGIPQFILLALIVLGMGTAAVKHGEPQPNYNFVATLVSAVIQIAILAWGGFFG